MATEKPIEERALETAYAIELAVSEIPDRTSPDDWPEAMIVTREELHGIVYEHIIAALQAQHEQALEIFLQGMTKTHFSKSEQKATFEKMLRRLESDGGCLSDFHDLAEDLFNDRMGES